MKDKEWRKEIEDEIIDLRNRVDKMEGILANRPEASSSCSEQNTIEADIECPEADIGGLRFNAVKTHAVFEKKGGIYYSRDILFNSARDTDNGTGRDLLSEYLDSEDVKKAFVAALDVAGINTDGKISIFIPKENQGIKRYNGVNWRYWLKPRSSGSSAVFAYVHANGLSYYTAASGVDGCAPAFCVSEKHE